MPGVSLSFRDAILDLSEELLVMGPSGNPQDGRFSAALCILNSQVTLAFFFFNFVIIFRYRKLKCIFNPT